MSTSSYHISCHCILSPLTPRQDIPPSIDEHIHKTHKDGSSILFTSIGISLNIFKFLSIVDGGVKYIPLLFFLPLIYFLLNYMTRYCMTFCNTYSMSQYLYQFFDIYHSRFSTEPKLLK